MHMAESHVVSALANKRAEIAGLIARARQQIGQCQADLAHLDATIRLFAPAMEPETILAKTIRQSDLQFEPGGLSRRVLDALRRAAAPIRVPDLVRAVMIDNGLDPADRDINRYKRVVGDALQSRTDARRATEVGIAVRALNRMLKLATPGVCPYRIGDESSRDRCVFCGIHATRSSRTITSGSRPSTRRPSGGRSGTGSGTSSAAPEWPPPAGRADRAGPGRRRRVREG